MSMTAAEIRARMWQEGSVVSEQWTRRDRWEHKITGRVPHRIVEMRLYRMDERKALVDEYREALRRERGDGMIEPHQWFCAMLPNATEEWRVVVGRQAYGPWATEPEARRSEAFRRGGLLFHRSLGPWKAVEA